MCQVRIVCVHCIYDCTLTLYSESSNVNCSIVYQSCFNVSCCLCVCVFRVLGRRTQQWTWPRPPGRPKSSTVLERKNWELMSQSSTTSWPPAHTPSFWPLLMSTQRCVGQKINACVNTCGKVFVTVKEQNPYSSKCTHTVELQLLYLWMRLTCTTRNYLSMRV